MKVALGVKMNAARKTEKQSFMAVNVILNSQYQFAAVSCKVRVVQLFERMSERMNKISFLIADALCQESIKKK